MFSNLIYPLIKAYTIKKQTTALTGEQLQNVSELYSANASEEDKIEAMMKQGKHYKIFFHDFK